ncbi:PAN domain protein [Ancylostoma ceylanicum]|uniref:PAN domain protein n=2 Tax=Ancylostoma ceylanicum TaxID=53326 RepID=A0A0D6M9L2_9BILA|nr:PAN domain protein [Ancylostoma ceylanicum]
MLALDAFTVASSGDRCALTDIMILRISLFLALLHSTLSSTFTSKCFSFKQNHGVSNSHSIAELFRVTIGDCLNYCILNAAKMGDGCAAVVYHKLYSTCQLYGHNGHFNGSAVVPADAHDFYERTSWVGVCQDKVGYKQRPRQYAAHTEPVSKPVDMSHLGNFVNLQAGRELVMEPTTTTTTSPPTPSFPDHEEQDDPPQVELQNTITFLNPTHSSECSKKEKISYFVLFGYRLASRGIAARLKGVDQSSCVMYCSQNINANGEAVPCYSANYEPVQEKCYLYGKRSRSDRHTAHLAVDSNYIFADKFCVETKKDCSAETPYIVYPFKQMHKKIITSYPGMNSVVACVAACIDSKKCKAVTYKIGLCILHGASPATDSGLLVDGSEQTMVIENGCQLTASTLPALLSNMLESSPDASQWEEWGPCQFGGGERRMRVRTRECTNCEDLQVEPC